MRKRIQIIISYILVAALASGITWFMADRVPDSKLERLADVIDRRFVGESNQTDLEDAAAEAMIAALGDRWSYYISAQTLANHRLYQNNEYVGIGVAVMENLDGLGYDIVGVTSGGPAEKAGVLSGDIITHADGIALADLPIDDVQGIIMGQENTKVTITLLRGEETLEISVTRKPIHSKVAESLLLDDGVGFILIENFYDGAAADTIAEIEKMIEQGATKLIFDVRYNPGGYVNEMVKLLDYLLPAGPIYYDIDSSGNRKAENSDADCLKMPMAVLINEHSYSAAELFAAVLAEYDWAVTVGESTIGKSYYQTTIELGDGSAAKLSVGAYTTPNGVNLTEVGGLVPLVPIAAAEGAVTVETDPQLQAAIQALIEETT